MNSCRDIDHDNHLILRYRSSDTFCNMNREKFTQKYKTKSKNKNCEKWIEVNNKKNVLNYLILRLTITQNNSMQQITKPNTAHTTMRLKASFTENFR